MSFVFLSFVCRSFPFCQFPCFSRYHAEPSLRPAPNACRISDPKSGMPEVVTNSRQKLDVSSNCHFSKMVMTMMSFPRSYYPPYTPITQQLCLRLYVGGLPLSLVRVHVKDRPKIGELLQIYDNLLLAHLM
jgi:hypothetical protein